MNADDEGMDWRGLHDILIDMATLREEDPPVTEAGSYVLFQQKANTIAEALRSTCNTDAK